MADSCVSRVPIFAGLTPQQHDQIASAATPTKAAAGQAIYRQGDLAAPLVVVHEGLVKLTRVSADGRERVLQVMEPGDFVGETTLLGGGRPDHSAIAATKATLCVFKPQDFTNLLATHPRISYLMLVEMNKRLAGADRLTQVVPRGLRPCRRLPARVGGRIAPPRASWSSCRCPRRTWPLARHDTRVVQSRHGQLGRG